LRSSLVSRKKGGASFNRSLSEGKNPGRGILSMKDRSMGVAISSTEDGVGSSCEITSCAWTRVTVATTSNSTNRNVVIKNRAKILVKPSGSNKEASFCSRTLHFFIMLLSSRSTECSFSNRHQCDNDRTPSREHNVADGVRHRVAQSRKLALRLVLNRAQGRGHRARP